MRKVFLFVLALCLALSFTGCDRIFAVIQDSDASKPHTTGVQKPPSPTQAPTTPVQTPAPTEPMEPEEVDTLLKSEISFGEDDFSAFEELLSGITVTYPYEELYNVMENYERAIAIPTYVSTHENYFADGVFTAKELFEIVKRNYTAQNFMEKRRLSDADLLYVCQIIAPILLEYAQERSDAEGAHLSEKVEGLVIGAYTGFAQGSYGSEDGILMYLDMKQKSTDKFPRTVRHETNHMLQGSTVAEQEAGGYRYRVGFSYFFEEGKDQPYEFNWIFEGAAELLTHNRLNSRQYDVYPYYIMTINYIKVATILREDVNDTSFEELTLSADINGVFDYFGYETEEQKRELLHMLVAINYQQRFSDQIGFRDRYEEKYGEDLSESAFRMGVIDALGRSLSREFYKNFANALKGKTVTVEDIFILNTLFEHRVCDYSLYRGVQPCMGMLQQYTQLQTEFFGILGEHLGVTSEEIQAVYDEYYKSALILAENIPLVTAAEADFLQYTTDASNNERFKSIYQQIMPYQ